MRNGETGYRKSFQSEELHNLYVLPDVDRMIKSSRKEAGHVAHMREKCIQSFVHNCLKIMCEMGTSVVTLQNTCIQGGIYVCLKLITWGKFKCKSDSCYLESGAYTSTASLVLVIFIYLFKGLSAYTIYNDLSWCWFITNSHQEINCWRIEVCNSTCRLCIRLFVYRSSKCQKCKL